MYWPPQAGNTAIRPDFVTSNQWHFIIKPVDNFRTKLPRENLGAKTREQTGYNVPDGELQWCNEIYADEGNLDLQVDAI